MFIAGRKWLHERGRQAWLALLVVGIAVAACCYYADRLTQWLAYDDEGGYLYAAWRISLGEAPYRDFLTPQLPMFLYPGAAVLALSGYSVYAARFSMIVYTIGAALLVGWAARRLWGDLAGLLTLVLTLVHQEIFWAARFFRPEAPMLFWGMLGLCLFVGSYGARRRVGLALAGVALGLATMSKLFGALMMVGVALFILAEALRSRNWRDMATTGLWTAVPYLMVVLGLTGLFTLVSRDFVAAVLGHHLRQGSGTPAPQVVGKALTLYWDYVRTQPVLWTLAALGIVAAHCAEPEKRVFVWQLPTLLAFLAMTRDLQARHFTYAVPSIALCAGVGLTWGLARAGRLWRWRGARWALSLCGVGVMAAVLLPQMSHNEWVASWADRTTPDWVRYIQERTAPGDVVIADYPGLNFYARRPSTRLAAGISRGAAQSGQIMGKDLIAEIEASDARMVLLNVAQGAHQFSSLRDYATFKQYVQQHFYLIERKQYDYRLIEVYHRDDLWAGEARVAQLGHELALTGVLWEAQEARPGEQALVLLRWQALAAMHDDYAVTLRLLDDTGQEWGLGSKSLVDIDRDTYWDESGLERAVDIPTSQWPPSELTIGHYELPVAPGTPPGTYNAVARVHRRGEWAGLAVSDGARKGYDVWLGAVTVLPGRADEGAAALEVAHLAALRLAGGATLLGADTATWQARPGDAFGVRLYWQLAADDDAAAQVAFWLAQPERVELHRGPLLGPNGRPEAVVAPTELCGQYLLRLPVELEPGSYALFVGDPDGAQVALGEVQVTGLPRVFEAPPMQQLSGARAEGVAVLLGYDLSEGPAMPGKPVGVTLYWRSEQVTDVGYVVFVHLIDTQDRIWAQHDGAPAGGEAPTSGWVPGQVVSDGHALDLPIDLPAGSYRLAVGMYNPATGERLELYDAAGARQPDDRLLLPTAILVAE
ncbi:MAG: phospholipid carrier-dependent glycosyltransferase [Anaerolineae bacterium]